MEDNLNEVNKNLLEDGVKKDDRYVENNHLLPVECKTYDESAQNYEKEKISPIEDDVTVEDEIIDRSIKTRLFGKIDSGSLRGSIFNLSIFSLGSGCLAIPQIFNGMSILGVVINVVLAGFAAYWTLNLMIISAKKNKVYNYSQLVKTVCGKGLATFLDITMLLYIFGYMVIYQVIGMKIF
jgi:hypothetical protein